MLCFTILDSFRQPEATYGRELCIAWIVKRVVFSSWLEQIRRTSRLPNSFELEKSRKRIWRWREDIFRLRKERSQSESRAIRFAGHG